MKDACDLLMLGILLVLVVATLWRHGSGEPPMDTHNREHRARRIEHYATRDHERKRLELRALRMLSNLPPGGWHS